MPFLLNLAPLVLVLVVLAYARTIWRRAPARWALATGVLGGVVVSALYVALILTHPSRTATLDLLFAPWIFVLAAGASAAWGFGLHQLAHTRQALRGGFGRAAAWAAAVLFLLSVTYYAARDARTVAGFVRIRWTPVDARLLEETYRSALTRRDYLQLAAVAAHPDTPPAILLAMAQSDDPGMHETRHGFVTLFDRDSLAVVRHVLRNPSAPPEVVRHLVHSPSDYVLHDVATSPHASAAILRELATRRDRYLVRWGLAVNPRTPPDLLEALAENADNITTQRLAGNPGTPAPILARLASSGSALARAAVAGNPSLDIALMERLAGDPEEEVRSALAANRRAPRPLLEQLTHDDSSRVRRYATAALRRDGSR